MEESLEKNFDDAFAVAWSENQGSYSETIAKTAEPDPVIC